MYKGVKAPYKEIQKKDVTSFMQLTGYDIKSSSAVADYIAERISNYNNGSSFLIGLGGPNFQGMIFKYSNIYYSILFTGYALYGSLELYSYVNGSYAYKRFGP